MHPDDVWVIYNTEQSKIIEVIAAEWLADRRLQWYWSDPAAPVTGSIANFDKIETMTLSQAVKRMLEIEKFYTR
jgi:hypothetical protein